MQRHKNFFFKGKGNPDRFKPNTQRFNLQNRRAKDWRSFKPRQAKLFSNLEKMWPETTGQSRDVLSARICKYFRKLGRISRTAAQKYSRRLSRTRRFLHARKLFLMRRRRVLGLREGPGGVYKKFILDYSKFRAFRYPFVYTAARSLRAAGAPVTRRSSFYHGFVSSEKISRNPIVKFLNPLRPVRRLGRKKHCAVSSSYTNVTRWDGRLSSRFTGAGRLHVDAPAMAARPGRRYLKRYMRKLWRAALRLKFERFFFAKLGRPTYVWFHSVWALFFRKFRRWRMSTVRFLVRARTRRRRKAGIALRFSMIKLLLRTVGILSTVSGSLFCFAHVLGFLMQRFRQHFQLLRVVRRFLVRARRKFRTIHFFRVVIVGKFGGAMRARKFLMKIGRRGKFLLLTRRLQYTMIHTHTQWGVFGIRIWTHVVSRPYSLRRVWYMGKPTYLQKRRLFQSEEDQKRLLSDYEEVGSKGVLRRERYIKSTLLDK